MSLIDKIILVLFALMLISATIAGFCISPPVGWYSLAASCFIVAMILGWE